MKSKTFQLFAQKTKFSDTFNFYKLKSLRGKASHMKIKKLKLKASARENRRYLVINEKDNEKIEKAILDYIGILGFAKASYMRVKEDNGKSIGSVKRQELEKVRASLALARIKVEKVSGTLKGLGK